MSPCQRRRSRHRPRVRSAHASSSPLGAWSMHSCSLLLTTCPHVSGGAAADQLSLTTRLIVSFRGSAVNTGLAHDPIGMCADADAVPGDRARAPTRRALDGPRRRAARACTVSRPIRTASMREVGPSGLAGLHRLPAIVALWVRIWHLTRHDPVGLAIVALWGRMWHSIRHDAPALGDRGAQSPHRGQTRHGSALGASPRSSLLMPFDEG